MPTPIHCTDFDGRPLSTEQTQAVVEELAEREVDAGCALARDGAPVLRPSRETIQRFVAFASLGLAYEITAPMHVRDDRDASAVWEYVPVLVDGLAVLVLPDEGRSGVLHVFRRTPGRRGQPHTPWLASNISCGWLTIEELAHVPGLELERRLAHER